MIAVKIKKGLKVLSIVLAALILLLVLLVLFWLGPMAKALVERIGPKVLGTPVTIEHLSINPLKGNIDLRGFQIGSHEGFSRTNTWELADFHVAIDMRSLFSDTLVIHEIQIDGPHLVYEQNQATDNISEFIRNIQAFADTDPNQPKPPKEDSGKPPKKVVIERLEINDLKVHLANTDDPELDVWLGLEQLSLSLTNGVVQLNHLLLSDPGLLSTPNVIEIESITVKIDPASIGSERIVIEDVRVTKPYAFLEQNADTDTVSEFVRLAQTFVDKFAQTSAPESARPPPTPNKAEGESPPFELHNLFVDDLQLKLLDTTRTNAAPEVQTLAAIGGISVKLIEGRIQIKDITIPNPDAGFTTTNLLHFARIDIDIDPESIFSKQVVIREVFVESPKINLEQTETTGNVAELQMIAKGFIPPAPESPAVAADAGETAKPLPPSEQPVLLQTLIVTNLMVTMTLPPETEGLMDKVSLKKINPLKLIGGGKTHVPPESGTIPLVAFDLLTVQPLDGHIRVDQLRVGNPRGFANPNLLALDQLRIDIDPGSMQSDVLQVEVLLDTPRIAYEQKLSSNNIKTLQASIEAAIARREKINKKPEASPEPETEEPGEPKAIVHLLVKNGTVRPKLSALPAPSVPLPDIEKTIGKEDGGATLGNVFSAGYGIFYDAVLKSVSGLAGFAGDRLKGAGSFTVGALGTLTGGATDKLGGHLGLDQPPDETAETEPVAEEPKEEKKRRPVKRRGRPGRHF